MPWGELVILMAVSVVSYFVGRCHERSKLRQRWRKNRTLPTITYMRQD